MDPETNEQKYDEKQVICRVSKYLPTTYLLIIKGKKVVTTVEKQKYNWLELLKNVKVIKDKDRNFPNLRTLRRHDS